MSDRPTPVIVFLSGHLRGKTRRLWGERLSIGTAGSADIPVAPHELPPGAADGLPGGELAALILRGRTYELECAPGARIWVNGEQSDRKVLASGDLLEIGEGGPVLRFRLYEPGALPYKSVSEAYSDSRDCARHGGGGILHRVRILLTGAPVELATQTSPRFRINLVIALALVVTMMAALTWRNVRLERDLIAERAVLEDLSGLLERTESRSFSAEDFVEARRGLEDRLSDTLARVEALESRAGSRSRVISAASRSVVFLQGGYGFVEGSSGKPLRLTASPEEESDSEVAPVSVNGSGPVVEILYTGTGFLASADGLLLTNRHVALPWEYDPTARMVVEEGYTPVMRRFRGYFAGEAEPFEVELLRSSDEADLALLRCDLGDREPGFLELSPVPPRPGAEVIVLGYPTGMNALLARTDPAFAEALLSGGPVDFWVLAEQLAAGGHVAPLATVGVVGQVTATSVVYDAETTHGGSGGPVLNLDGKVVAVNSAVMPEFGGSNLGVPARRAAKLMAPPPAEPAGPEPD